MTAETTTTCWSCGAAGDASAGLTHCTSCAAVLPPRRQADPFARLGVGLPRFGVDPAELEHAYLRCTRAVHPDRHARKSDRERRHAAEQTAAVNDAYRTIAAPFDRAVWLLAQTGAVPPSPGPAELMAFMEMREEAEVSATARQRVVDDSTQRFHDAMRHLETVMASLDGKPGGFATSSSEAVRGLALLGELRTLARLVDDLAGIRLLPSLLNR